MKYTPMTALRAVATILAHPFRAPQAPVLTLTAPTVDVDVVPGHILEIPAGASLPRGVFAAPRAEAPTDPKAMVEQINANWTAFKSEVEANLDGRLTPVSATLRFRAASRSSKSIG